MTIHISETPSASITLKGTAEEARRFLARNHGADCAYDSFQINENAVWVAVDYDQFENMADDGPFMIYKLRGVRCYANGDAAGFRAERGSAF